MDVAEDALSAVAGCATQLHPRDRQRLECLGRHPEQGGGLVAGEQGFGEDALARLLGGRKLREAVAARLPARWSLRGKQWDWQPGG